MNPHYGRCDEQQRNGIGAYKHRLALHLSHLVAEQILRQHHARRPQLAAALFLVCLKDQRRVQKAVECEDHLLRWDWDWRRYEIF